jgi:glycogen debranching enzyme
VEKFVVNKFITIKDDYIFLVSDEAGNLRGSDASYGLYYKDTRYLSLLEFKVSEQLPELLSYHTEYNIGATFRLSSSLLSELQGTDSALAPDWTTAAHAIGITRRRFIRQGLIENITLTNYHPSPVSLTASLRIGTDFADLFQIRGFPHELQGEAAKIELNQANNQVLIHSLSGGYASAPKRTLQVNLDQIPVRYEQASRFSQTTGQTVAEITLFFELNLAPQAVFTLNLNFMPDPEGRKVPALTDFYSGIAEARQVFTDWKQYCTGIQTANFALNKIYETGMLDLRSLMQRWQQGLIVTAGLPWYFTLFGRDSLITAIQTLSLNPQIAVDTLRVLASYQATDFDDWRDSEPGKILHELRLGDMTMNGHMPHSPYYGSIDSTLLFILAFAETLKWTKDAAFFAEMWEAVEKALEWAKKYGDVDGDGYIEFERRSTKRGILHQGWKDSDESMGGVLGARPVPPIALVEVQGYYYAAKVALAEVIRQFGSEAQQALADELEKEAQRLKARFNRDFWWEEEGFFAQALDGNKQQVRNVTSNPGHCLWSGIVDADKAAKVAKRLTQPDMLSGWGVRTISDLDVTYNPMSYHNGSIWPHDNALIIAGLRRYGFNQEALTVAGQILAAAATIPDYRLPELYCGFARTEADEQAPVAYPVSCSPQAWAAGTPFLLLQALLDLRVSASSNVLALAPILPSFMPSLSLHNLRVGQSSLNLTFEPQVDSKQVRVIYSFNNGAKIPVEGDSNFVVGLIEAVNSAS